VNVQGSKRTYGTGSLFTRRDAWYGQWRQDGRLVKRKIGPKRTPGERDGLTKSQAEARLRGLMQETAAAPLVSERVTVQDAGERLITHLESLGRKPSTVDDYRSILRVHLATHFGTKALGKITPSDVEGYIAAKHSSKQAVKTTLNQLGFLHSIFTFGERRGWATDNPCKRIDKPRKQDADTIRFLDQEELEAVLRAARDHSDRTLYLTAAMTGLRRGELLALRWRDIDWTAQRVRVRENYVRGRIGKPKSKRSTRSVPLADRVAGELERHYKQSEFQADDALVFTISGDPLDPSRVRKRFTAAVKRAKVRAVRFHDLRHTFGTRMAAAGVSMRTLQEWLGHRDFATTLIYADYQPGSREAELVNEAFGAGINSGIKLSDTEEPSATPSSTSGT
jgi:integrase